MAKKSVVALLSLAILLATGAAWAQTTPTKGQDDKVFDLTVGDAVEDEITETETEEEKYVPAIEAGRWDLSLTLGYFNLNKTLLQHDSIIYKATDEAFYYGDMKLVGESAFNPILRIGYNFTSWLALETQFGVSFANYEQEITNPYSISPEGGGNPEEVEEIGEFDPEHRSVLVFIGNLNAVWYPLNMSDGEGRWHPYVTGGAGYAYYNLDSNYTDTGNGSASFNLGGGIRVIADSMISVRAEILYQVHSIQFSPAETFDSRDADTVQIPVYEFDETGTFTRVKDYKSETLGGLTWQLGFVVSF